MRLTPDLEDADFDFNVIRGLRLSTQTYILYFTGRKRQLGNCVAILPGIDTRLFALH
jgi:hypothetical protein